MSLLGKRALWIIALSLAACGPLAGGEPRRPTRPAATRPASRATSTALPPTTPATEATPAEAAAPAEAIFLRRPASGSRVVSPLTVAGTAAPTFEQALLLRLLDFDQTVLAEEAVVIEAPLGESGPFAGELAFAVSTEQPAALQVMARSARDGGIIHLTAHIVTLLPTGPAEVRTASPHPERIQIRSPEAGSVVTGGRVTVTGFGLASFEQTLVVEVQDATGDIVGQAPLSVDSPEMGAPGPFAAQVTYQVDSAGPGRISVRDPSPAYGGPVHLASVEVELRP